MKVTALLFFILSLPAFASGPETNGRIIYIVKPDSLSLNLAAEYIYRGLPLAPEQLSAEVVSDDIKNIGDLLKAKTSEHHDQTRNTIFLTRKELARPGATHLLPEVEVKKPSLNKLNLSGYFNCLKESTPLFKRLLSLKEQGYIEGPEQKELIENIKLRLNQERGLLGLSSLEGTICGMYLGELAFTDLPELLTYKFLIVMETLDDKQKKELLSSLISVFHPDSPLEDKLIFLKLVEFQMSKVYFKKSQFDLMDMGSDYLALLSDATQNNETSTVTIRQMPINNWEKILKAHSWAMGHLQ